jgi:hypothetical protein
MKGQFHIPNEREPEPERLTEKTLEQILAQRRLANPAEYERESLTCADWFRSQ